MVACSADDARDKAQMTLKDNAYLQSQLRRVLRRLSQIARATWRAHRLVRGETRARRREQLATSRCSYREGATNLITSKIAVREDANLQKKKSILCLGLACIGWLAT